MRLNSLLPLKERLFDRLREARQRIGLKQVELASIGQVSRVTQVSYETDLTAPNTNYLKLVQGAGIDISYVLFGLDKSSLGEDDPTVTLDWKLLQHAFEEVEFFCIKAAPNCPSSYRWQLVKRVYEELASLKDSPVSSPQDIVRNAWEKA